jgi:hypothetical protein
LNVDVRSDVIEGDNGQVVGIADHGIVEEGGMSVNVQDVS